MRQKTKGLIFSLDVAVFALCIAIFSLVGVYGIQTYVKSSRIGQAKADTASIALAVQRYAYDMGIAYPDYKPAQCLPSSLVVLASKDTTTGCGPWIAENSLKKSGSSYLDPWGHAYVYSHGSDNDGRFVVYSKGPENNGSVAFDGTVSNQGIGVAGGIKM